MLEGEHTSTKIGLARGVTIEGDAAKNGNNTNFSVVMCVRLLQKIGMIDLTNRTRFKKGNGYKMHTKKCAQLLSNALNTAYRVYLLLSHKYRPPESVRG